MIQQRRRPQQSRSKERVEVILEAARELIGEHGIDAISVRSIAARAGVPISSVYQYFPDKNAIVRQLVEAYRKQFLALLMSDYQHLTTPQELLLALQQSVDRYLQFFLKEPAFAMIWAGVQADPTLRLLDLQDSDEHARFFAQQVTLFLGEEHWQEVFGISLFFVSVAGPVIRLALYADEPTRTVLLSELKVMIALRMKSIFDCL
jgi:AcrR family transcriptional regulator